MIKKQITYFEKAGKHNTNDLIKVLKSRLNEEDIRFVVVASSTGETALKLWKEIKSLDVKLVVVSLHAGFRGGDSLRMSNKIKEELLEDGVMVYIGSHILSGLGRSITDRFGGTTFPEMIAHTLRRFSGHGIKVAVEVAIMAADAGFVPTNETIISIGGSKGGADTAITLQASHMNNFFDLEIKEIIAKPLSSE